MNTTEYLSDPIEKDIRDMVVSNGRSVFDLSMQSPVLLVFLRHFGCTFCREALSDLSKKQDEFAKQQVQLVLVHMSDEETATSYFEKYQLKQFEAISDPDCRYYEKFGLAKGTMNQLFGLRVWLRGFEAGVLNAHGIGPMMGDGFQMPGVFLIHNGKLREKFIHQFASDRPDYGQLISCCDVDSNT